MARILALSCTSWQRQRKKYLHLDVLQLAWQNARGAGVGPVDPHHLNTCSVSHMQLERPQSVAEVAHPPAGIHLLFSTIIILLRSCY